MTSEDTGARPLHHNLVPRVVIDTNVWISRLLTRHSTAARAVDMAIATCELLMSDDALAELDNVLARPKFDRYVSQEDRKRFVQLAGGLATRIVPVVSLQACRDPADDKLLELALSGMAHALVTGDEDLLAMHPFREVAIVRPAAFLQSGPVR